MNELTSHYAANDFYQRLLELLPQPTADKCDAVEKLAVLDSLHTRGRRASAEMADLLPLEPAMRVLDLGCGLGGTARYLAAQYGCLVTGVDLVPEFVQAATRLSKWAHLSEDTEFVRAEADQLPFADGSFDVVWTEHVSMNILQKRPFYLETHRVLRAGGRLAQHEVLAGNHAGLTYPLPWAATPSMSYLSSQREIEQELHAAGFVGLQWHPVTEPTTRSLQKLRSKWQSRGGPPAAAELLLGRTAAEKVENYWCGLTQNCLEVAMLTAEKLPMES